MIIREEIDNNCVDLAECGCRIWMGRLNDQGYGVVSRSRKEPVRSDVRMHRRSWEATFGPIPTGLSVLHRCDVRACINPDHLFLGTQRDNMRDMNSKGRGRIPNVRGERQGSAKLTAENVREIRRLAQTMTQDCVARLFLIDRSNVGLIVRRKAWKHVDN